MKSTEVSAKTIELAIAKGLEELGGLSRDAVVIEVLAEPEPGSFLGIGRKPARVRLTEIAPQTTDNMAAVLADQANEAVETAALAEDIANLPVGFADYVEPETEKEVEAYSETDSLASDPLHKAAKFLQAILTNLHVKDELKFSETDSEMHFNISGSDCGILIGRRGDTLRSLQYLTSLVVHQAGSDKRVVLDIGDYYEKRKQALINLAKKTARRSIISGNAFELNPMRSHDRRVIHEALAGITGIVTYSEGEDPNRYVVIDLGEDYHQGMPMPAQLEYVAEVAETEELELANDPLTDPEYVANEQMLETAADLAEEI